MASKKPGCIPMSVTVLLLISYASKSVTMNQLKTCGHVGKARDKTIILDSVEGQ